MKRWTPLAAERKGNELVDVQVLDGNLVTVFGRDDEGQGVEDSDTAEVRIIDEVTRRATSMICVHGAALSFDDLAVLYRTDAQSAAVAANEAALAEARSRLAAAWRTVTRSSRS